MLDLLGYGSIIDSKNTGKAAITKKYLGVDDPGDADNPLVYHTSQTVNALITSLSKEGHSLFLPRFIEWRSDKDEADPLERIQSICQAAKGFVA